MQYMKMRNKMSDNLETEDDNSIDDFIERLEIISRTTPTTMPEWMD